MVEETKAEKAEEAKVVTEDTSKKRTAPKRKAAAKKEEERCGKGLSKKRRWQDKDQPF
jgi:hypothetical protein